MFEVGATDLLSSNRDAVSAFCCLVRKALLSFVCQMIFETMLGLEHRATFFTGERKARLRRITDVDRGVSPGNGRGAGSGGLGVLFWHILSRAREIFSSVERGILWRRLELLLKRKRLLQIWLGTRWQRWSLRASSIMLCPNLGRVKTDHRPVSVGREAGAWSFLQRPKPVGHVPTGSVDGSHLVCEGFGGQRRCF